MQNDQSNQGRPQVDFVESTIATNVDVFYHELGEDLAKKRLPFLNDLLRQLLTISISLAGGGLYFLDVKMCHPGLKLVGVGLFFLAALFALIGVLPYRDKICANNPDEVKLFVETAIGWKDGWVWAVACFLLLGFLLVFLGVLIKQGHAMMGS